MITLCIIYTTILHEYVVKYIFYNCKMIISNNQPSFNLLSKSTYIYSRTSRNQQEDLKKQFTANSRKDHGNLKKKNTKNDLFPSSPLRHVDI